MSLNNQDNNERQMVQSTLREMIRKTIEDTNILLENKKPKIEIIIEEIKTPMESSKPMRCSMQRSSSFSFEEDESMKGSMLFPVNANKPEKSKFYKNNEKKKN